MSSWRKSSYSDAAGQNCVELARLESDKIGIRDSKHLGDGPLSVRSSELAQVVARIRQGS
nr:DUF397 domain-containing protein [Actinomadura oligospora]